jgi:hypothetical protein
LTYEDLIESAISLRVKASCYTLCGNSADPSCGIYVQMPRVNQNIEFEADSDYSLASNAASSVQEFFAKKFPDFKMYGDDLGPINPDEYNQVRMENFKNVEISAIKFGFQLRK